MYDPVLVSGVHYFADLVQQWNESLKWKRPFLDTVQGMSGRKRQV